MCGPFKKIIRILFSFDSDCLDDPTSRTEKYKKKLSELGTSFCLIVKPSRRIDIYDQPRNKNCESLRCVFKHVFNEVPENSCEIIIVQGARVLRIFVPSFLLLVSKE